MNHQNTDEYAEVSAGSRKRGGNVTWFEIFDGSICRRSNRPVDGWEERKYELKDGRQKTTYVEWWKHIVGRIVGISTKEKSFDSGSKITNVNIFLQVPSTKKILGLRVQVMDQFLQRFIMCSPNIDFDKPVFFSAWTSIDKETNKRSQAVWIKQGPPGSLDDWTSVTSYWARPKGPDGKPIQGSEAVGADGSVLPQPEFYPAPGTRPEDRKGTWNFAKMEHFLYTYLVEQVMPKAKANGDKYNPEAAEDEDQDGGEVDNMQFSGPAPEDTLEVVVTDLPNVVLASGPGDAMTLLQQSRIRADAAALGMDAESVTQKLCGCSFHELNVRAAAYLIHRLQERLAKTMQHDAPAVSEQPPAQVPVQQQAVPAATPSMQDDW